MEPARKRIESIENAPQSDEINSARIPIKFLDLYFIWVISVNVVSTNNALRPIS